MKVIAVAVVVLALLSFASAAWTPDHEITGDASKLISDGVKAKLTANLDKIANQAAANSLLADLNQTDDSKRTLLSIDNATANQLFSIFGLKDPGCDKDNNGQVLGDQLKCLGKIWKSFVPK